MLRGGWRLRRCKPMRCRRIGRQAHAKIEAIEITVDAAWARAPCGGGLMAMARSAPPKGPRAGRILEGHEKTCSREPRWDLDADETRLMTAGVGPCPRTWTLTVRHRLQRLKSSALQLPARHPILR